jgi:hypothetical protein
MSVRGEAFAPALGGSLRAATRARVVTSGGPGARACSGRQALCPPRIRRSGAGFSAGPGGGAGRLIGSPYVNLSLYPGYPLPGLERGHSTLQIPFSRPGMHPLQRRHRVLAEYRRAAAPLRSVGAAALTSDACGQVAVRGNGDVATIRTICAPAYDWPNGPYDPLHPSSSISRERITRRRSGAGTRSPVPAGRRRARGWRRASQSR